MTLTRIPPSISAQCNRKIELTDNDLVTNSMQDENVRRAKPLFLAENADHPWQQVTRIMKFGRDFAAYSEIPEAEVLWREVLHWARQGEVNARGTYF